MKTLGDPRCRQTDHSPMPSIARDDDKLSARQLGRFHQRQLGDLLLDLLSLSVATVEDRREPACFIEILALEQLDNVFRDIHPSSGVDPRCDPKADVIARHVRTAVRNLPSAPSDRSCGCSEDLEDRV
jgi:hypothetical protein